MAASAGSRGRHRKSSPSQAARAPSCVRRKQFSFSLKCKNESPPGAWHTCCLTSSAQTGQRLQSSAALGDEGGPSCSARGAVGSRLLLEAAPHLGLGLLACERRPLAWREGGGLVRNKRLHGGSGLGRNHFLQLWRRSPWRVQLQFPLGVWASAYKALYPREALPVHM